MAPPPAEFELAVRAHEQAPMLSRDEAADGEAPPPSLDALYAVAGGFGRCQAAVLCVSLWAWVVHGAQVMSMVFVGPGLAAELEAREPLLQLTGSFFFAGWFLGLGLWGWLAARRGWLAALCCLEGAVVVFGCCSAAATGAGTFLFARFLCGFAEGGVPTVSFGWASEFAAPKHKASIGTVLQCGFVAGSLMVTGISYAVGDRWRLLSGAISVMPLPVVLAALYMPESPRWLLGRSGDETMWRQALLRVAEMNGRLAAMTDALNSERMQAKDLHKGCKGASSSTSGSIADLLQDGPLARMSLVVCFQWFTIAATFFGLSLVSSSLPGGAHLNMLVMAICQCPALATTLCSLQWFGRRSTILALLFLIGFSCTVLALCLEGSPTLRVVFALIGSASTSSAFSAEYIFTGELYPTSVRSMGLSVGSQVARIGAFFSPVILLLRYHNPALPFAVWGALALVAAYVSLLLPETGDTDSLETVHDLHLLLHRCGCTTLLGSKADRSQE